MQLATRYHYFNMNIPVIGIIANYKVCVQDNSLSLEEADSIWDKMLQEEFYSPIWSIGAYFMIALYDEIEGYLF